MDTTNILVSTIRGEDLSTTQESLPSLYEVLLVDQIDRMLKPTFRQILSAITELIPASVFELRHSIQEHWEELYDMIILIVQYRLIRTYGSTLPEMIYGLQRRGISGGESYEVDSGKALIKATKTMSKWQNDVSIFLVVVLPRFVSVLTRISAIVRERRRARHRFEENQRRIDARNAERGGLRVTGAEHFEENDGRLNENSLLRLSRRAYVRTGAVLFNSLEWLGESTALAVPFIVASCGGVVTFQRLRYLFGYTPHHHPILELVKTVLVRRNSELHGPNDPIPHASHARVSAEQKPNWRLLALLGVTLTLRIIYWVARQDESNATAIRALSFATNEGSGGPHSSTAEIPMPPPPPGIGEVA